MLNQSKSQVAVPLSVCVLCDVSVEIRIDLWISGNNKPAAQKHVRGGSRPPIPETENPELLEDTGSFKSILHNKQRAISKVNGGGREEPLRNFLEAVPASVIVLQ